MTLPKTFVPGERIFASDFNANLEALDNAIPGFKVASGVTGTLSPSSAADATAAITFASGTFTAAPGVSVTMGGTFTPAIADNLNVFVESVSSSGFTIRTTNSSATSQNLVVYWVAVQNA